MTDAALWLQSALLGTVATTIAIVAVAALGFAMLTGRTDWRRGAITILGCFILFGAGTIAAGIRSAGSSTGEPIEPSVTPYVVPALTPPPASLQPLPHNGDDPYAGAAVPLS